MVVVCSVCNSSVHLLCGFIERHVSQFTGVVCSGSGTPYSVSSDSCCGL